MIRRLTFGLLFFIALSSAGGEILLLKNGEKLVGDVVVAHDRGVSFRAQEGAPGRYYPFEEVARISTGDGVLYYLMPRGKKKKSNIPFFPKTSMILPRLSNVPLVPYLSPPQGDPVEANCSDAEDAVTLLLEGKTRVRLLGLAPPPPAAGAKVARKAREYLSSRVRGRGVQLFPGPQGHGESPHPEAYVLIGNAMLNAEMIEKGWACVSTSPPEYRYREAFLSLQKMARNLHCGMWHTYHGER